uniref:uncharacterized protein LOC143308998 n=1 Tax=Arvicanthis niloticus TaxID=61156 RepID=UPI00402BBB99
MLFLTPLTQTPATTQFTTCRGNWEPAHNPRAISNSSADDPGRMNQTPASRTEGGLVLTSAQQQGFLIKAGLDCLLEVPAHTIPLKPGNTSATIIGRFRGRGSH